MTTARKPADAPVARPDQPPLRFVTAASLFDGHDAAINIMRRIIQSQGAEVIHLGHNRSVEDVVRAALQEDADGIAISSYQGGHMEYFRYMVDMLKERHASHIRVFGGGGGTITPEEIAELHAYGVERIYHPNDGMHMGLGHMIEDVVQRAEKHRRATERPAKVALDDEISVGKMLSAIEEGALGDSELAKLRKEWEFAGKKTPVIGVTGTGGAGKSSVVDELLLRFLQSFPEMRIAVLAVDPTRRRTGGALLGDRIRMNSLRSKRVFMRSMATRRQHAATSAMLHDCIGFLRGQGYDMVIVETAGIGQSDSAIVDLVDFATYVMTSDYGAASQLEKIDMLDYAELVVLNKFDRRGAEDALRDVRKQWKRNRTAFKTPDEEVPVYPTIASQFNDPGITWMFVNLCRLLREKLSLQKRGQSPFSNQDDGKNKSEGSKKGSDPFSTEGRPRCDFNPHVDTSIKEPRATVLIPGAPQVHHRRALRLRSARQGHRRQQLHRILEPSEDPQDRRTTLQELGGPLAFPHEGKPAGRVSLHRRRVSISPHRRRSHPHVRRRGHARAHQPPFPLPLARPGIRAPVHRVRFGHALRRRPGRTPGHLRQDRQLRRQHRHPQRHEEALFGLRSLRSQDLRVHDHQRPGADDPGHVHEHRHRSAGGEIPQSRLEALGGGGKEDRGHI
jgi:methylmalonyl-CoA mutase cobalamin-binding domain/chain